MPGRGLVVASTTRVLDLEQIFLGDPALSSVVVSDPQRAPVCLTRARFFAALTGRLGFGRSLYTRHALWELPHTETLHLPSTTSIVDAVQAVLERAEDSRYDDFVVSYPNGTFAALCVADLFAELAHLQAFEGLHDALTGLANRRLFLGRLGAAHATGEAFAVLFVDVDDFKTINDGLGHDVGDEALTVIAGRLASVAGAGATVARLGGDEFGILLPGVERRVDGERAAGRIVAALSAPLRTGEVRAMLSASVGVALGREADTAEELLRNADLAMYAAKRRGKGAFACYEPGMHEAPKLRLELEGALARDELFLLYQPIVELETSATIAAEALLRWRRADGSVVSPADFVPLCEQTGLIIPVGRFVLHEACRQAVAWSERPGVPPLRVTVNISPRQLQYPGLVDDVASALADTGLPPSALTLEITEGVIIRDMETALARLAECRALGVRIALDDFGSGFSSLSRLSRMPIDALKLDRAFIAQLDTREGRGLVAGVVALAHSLELVTVAEGVETLEQAQALRAVGCERAQGFLYARPMPAELVGDGGELVAG